MNYIGEHLLPGQLGHFFVVLALVASAIATYAYARSVQAPADDERNWRRMGRVAFIINACSVFLVFGTIFYIVYNHYFEYYYAWNHTSRDLSTKYLFAAIWEGQEGSFLLWSIWQGVIGLLLLRRRNKWEAPVMAVVAFSQFLLSTMFIGLVFGDVKIGSNPFVLVREMFAYAPVFQRPDYLMMPQMQDGQGLGQALQNYWMVIHPPVLFLGLAATIVPFAYAIAGIWRKDYGGWTKIALPWNLFAAAALGLGIMMGAAWAYESLTFGGFWAWDPVENASLVPWLVLVAGIHTQVVYNATGHSLRATTFFFVLTYSFSLFESFLTRSGVLGDSSVHSFVSAGMNLQLLLQLLLFLVPGIILFSIHYKRIPHIAKEEEASSREFWMFIGSLVLFLSGIVITWQTSFTPIYNKITGKTTAMPEDPEFAYNKIQIFVAIVIALLTGAAQYLKYKKTGKSVFLKKSWLPFTIALAITLLFSFSTGLHYDAKGAGFLGALYLGLFAGMYTLVANIMYIWSGLNGRMKAAGASIAHFGFGVLLVGIIIAASNKKVLSLNTSGIMLRFAPSAKQNPMENLTLIKGMKTDMGDYWTTYVNNDSTNAHATMIYYRIDMARKDSSEAFTLYPNLIRNTKGQENFSNNPDSRHYWNKDIFSYISYADDIDKREDTATFKPHTLKLGDTVYYSNGFVILNKVVPNPAEGKYHFAPTDTALMADLTVVSKEGSRYGAKPVFYVEDNEARYMMDTVFSQNLAIGFSKVLANQQIELQLKESKAMVPYVALKVYEFPHINLVWLGTLITVAGFVMSIIYRRRQGRLKAVNS
ncbi:MAG: cytochrome c biogenesis protein CcsA [Bacteroidetes bacterium]|nr:cytochrome c biogenesis protein CcsA [Bacteroidota bacterium]